MGTAKTKSPISLLALAVLLGGAPASQAAPAPGPEELLDQALDIRDIPYQGRMMVTYWYGKQTRAEEVEVYHNPPYKTRREFLAPDGSVDRVIVSDGEREEVRLLKQGKVVGGDAVKSYQKLMTPEKERELLLKNYEVSVLGAEKVAGRPAWILELKPRDAGKPYQRLWVDQQTQVVLENKRFTPRKAFASLSRYTRFEPKQALDDSLFELEAATAAVAGHGLAPDFMSLEDLNKETGGEARLPAELPGGFVFESADFFEVDRHTVRHARYTDGLAILSVFQTDRPVRLPKSGAVVTAASPKGAGTLRLSSSGKVLSWRRGRGYFTLMGDVSRELLQNISSRLKS